MCPLSRELSSLRALGNSLGKLQVSRSLDAGEMQRDLSWGQTGKGFDVRQMDSVRLFPIWKRAEANMFHNLEHMKAVGKRQRKVLI